ncbi:hypothetical protein KW797_02470 [Candidatus Parcubacteria bacterium]|nr:hypothetical protein [Candidatus Parcubacteria bacterium]
MMLAGVRRAVAFADVSDANADSFVAILAKTPTLPSFQLKLHKKDILKALLQIRPCGTTLTLYPSEPGVPFLCSRGSKCSSPEHTPGGSLLGSEDLWTACVRSCDSTPSPLQLSLNV